MLMKWLQRLKNQPGEQKMRPIHYFIVLLGIGVAFMIVTDFLQVQPDRSPGEEYSQTPTPATDPPSVPVLGSSTGKDLIREYEHQYETQLSEMLESIIGVGKVEVMVNLDSTPELVLEKNRDTRLNTTQEVDKDKATRNQSDQSRNEQVVVVQGSKTEQPVVVKTLKPKVRGVLVVAKGAENIQVKAWITEAVQKVLDVPAYKISILPKKG